MNQDNIKLAYDKAYNYFLECNKDKMNEIINHIKSFKDSIKIDIKTVSQLKFLEMLASVAKNEEVDMNVELTQDGIVLPFEFNEFYEVIFGDNNKSITSLSTNAINYGDFFELFPNLKEISLPFISNNILKSISDNTNIKTINGVNYLGGINLTNSINDGMKVVYNDLVINGNMNLDKKKIDVYCDKNIDFNLLTNNYNLNDYEFIKIHSDMGEIEIKTGESLVATFKNINLDVIPFLYNKMVDSGIHLSQIKFSIEDRSEIKIKYSDYDYKEFDELAKKVDIVVGYDSSFIRTSSYDEFKSLVESIKWFQGIIKDYPLSPLEKLTFAYDIMKTFEYKGELSDPKEARQPSKIITGDKIVCAGYTALLSEILYGLDENIKSGSFSVECYEDDDTTLKGYHSRSVVKVDDDKYNIHGYYILDPTWDSVKQNGKEKIDKDYDALSLYWHYLVPITQYKEIFPHDSIPVFFNSNHSSLNYDLSDSNVHLELEKINEEEEETKKTGKFTTIKHPYERLLSGIFPKPLVNPNENVNNIVNDFKSRRINLDEFLNLIRNVRSAEGYNGKILEDEVDKIKRINGNYFEKKEDKNEEVSIQI